MELNNVCDVGTEHVVMYGINWSLQGGWSSSFSQMHICNEESCFLNGELILAEGTRCSGQPRSVTLCCPGIVQPCSHTITVLCLSVLWMNYIQSEDLIHKEGQALVIHLEADCFFHWDDNSRDGSSILRRGTVQVCILSLDEEQTWGRQ